MLRNNERESEIERQRGMETECGVDSGWNQKITKKRLTYIHKEKSIILSYLANKTDYFFQVDLTRTKKQHINKIFSRKVRQNKTQKITFRRHYFKKQLFKAFIFLVQNT